MRNSTWEKIRSISFIAVNDRGDTETVGGEIVVTVPPEIRFDMEYKEEFESGSELLSEVQLVRNGEVIAQDTLEFESGWVFRDVSS